MPEEVRPRLVECIMGQWARANGLDPYSLERWLYGDEPTPPAVKERLATISQKSAAALADPECPI